MQRFLHTIRTSLGLRQSALVIGGNLAAVSLSGIATILVSRTLGPNLFGQFSVGFAVIQLMSRFMDLGLSPTLQKYAPKTSSKNELLRIFSLTTQLKIIVTAGLALIGVILSPILASYLRFDNVTLLALAFILAAATVLYEHLSAMLQSLHRFGGVVVSSALSSFLKLLAAIGAFFVGGQQLLGIFTAYMIAPASAVLVARRYLPELFELRLLKKYRSERQKLQRMIGHAAIGFMAAGVIDNIDILLVQHYLSDFQTGLYSGVARINLLFLVIPYSLANVLNPRVAKYTQHADRVTYVKKALLLAAAALVVGIAVLPFAQLGISWSIGDAYLAATRPLQILIYSSFITIATIPFLALFYAFKDGEWFFSVSGIVQLVMIIGANILLVPMLGVSGAAWARLISRVGLFTLTIGVAMYYLWQSSRS